MYDSSPADVPPLSDFPYPLGDSLTVKPLALVVAMLLCLIGAVAPAMAQGQYLQVDGWVQWISADRLQLVLDNGRSISVDLTRVPQYQYHALGLGPRDRVSVIGVISADNRRLIATSVTRADRLGIQAP